MVDFWNPTERQVKFLLDMSKWVLYKGMKNFTMTAERHGSPSFYSLLDEMAKLHDEKSHDYASNDNPSGNYHFAGELALLFAHSSQDAGFVGRIGEKLYRLANLESSGKTPKNETIEDTERDICVIICLWMADRRDRRNKPNPLQTELLDLITLMPDSQTEEIINYIMELRKTRSNYKQTNMKLETIPISESESAGAAISQLIDDLNFTDLQKVKKFVDETYMKFAK